MDLGVLKSVFFDDYQRYLTFRFQDLNEILCGDISHTNIPTRCQEGKHTGTISWSDMVPSYNNLIAFKLESIIMNH